jgi:hypothetical protein
MRLPPLENVLRKIRLTAGSHREVSQAVVWTPFTCKRSYKLPKTGEVMALAQAPTSCASARALGPSACSQLMARARFSVCTILGLAPSADAHDHRALPCPVIGPSPAAPARQATTLGTPTPSACTERARARANPVVARLRSTSCDSSRATRLHLRRLHRETRRHRTREPRDHAAPSGRRITTRRRLPGGVR